MPPEDRRILLLGATGQVGHELRRTLAPLGTLYAPGRNAVDLADPKALRSTVQHRTPDVVVNAAAYTDVDGAEEAPGRAAVLNAEAPGVLAEAACDAGAWLVHYSTDYVFDGTQQTPYVETDAPNPINVYGRTKRDGENAIRSVGAPHVILRTSWVYSARRSNFLLTILRLADTHDRLTVVDDQIGAPTWAGWIAAATRSIVQQLGADEAVGGTYHLAAGGQTSWYGFARAIFAQYGLSDVEVVPVSSDEYPTAAARPAYTVLCSDRVRQRFGVDVPSWTEQLAEHVRRARDAPAAEPRDGGKG
ncbi:MAG: dTDP-4-dehydrorhamnose reductase [Salinivenus sp.]